MLAGSALSQLRSHWPAHSAVTTAAHFRSRSILRPCHAVLLGPLFPLVVTACHGRSPVTPSCGTARLSAIAPLASRLLLVELQPPQPPGRSTASSRPPHTVSSLLVSGRRPPLCPKPFAVAHSLCLTLTTSACTCTCPCSISYWLVYMLLSSVPPRSWLSEPVLVSVFARLAVILTQRLPTTTCPSRRLLLCRPARATAPRAIYDPRFFLSLLLNPVTLSDLPVLLPMLG